MVAQEDQKKIVKSLTKGIIVKNINDDWLEIKFDWHEEETRDYPLDSNTNVDLLIRRINGAYKEYLKQKGGEKNDRGKRRSHRKPA